MNVLQIDYDRVSKIIRNSLRNLQKIVPVIFLFQYIFKLLLVQCYLLT